MEGPMDRMPRTLNAVEARVLGVLMEKQQTTPEYYPLTLKALTAGCNQKSNRDPVMALDTAEIADALVSLQQDVLVWKSAGARADRWEHNLERRWQLTPGTKAVMTLLLLRGAQTPGELRSRSERMHGFASIAEVEEALAEVSTGHQPLVQELARQPGQKETRWMDCVSEREAPTAVGSTGPVAAAPMAAGSPAPEPLAQRVSALEERVERLEALLDELTS